MQPPGAAVGAGEWAGLAALLSAGVLQGGDEVVLAPGRHGEVRLAGLAFDPPVMIRGAEGEGEAILDRLHIAASRGLVFRDLVIEPPDPAAHLAAHRHRGTVHGEPDASDLAFIGLLLRNGPDAEGYADWPTDTWRAQAVLGLYVRGDRVTVRGVRVVGHYHGIHVEGADSLLEGNSVEGFSGDGMRALGDRSVVRGNLVTDCIAIDDNHDDGFQAWARDGRPLVGLVIEANRIVEWRPGPRPPQACRLQGIGLFDGPYDDLVVRNNIVLVRHWHGISVAGPRWAQILHNTVAHPDGETGEAPWLAVWNRRDGAPPEETLVAGNLATRFSGIRDGGVRYAGNAELTIPSRQLPGLAAHDLRPSAASRFVGAARGGWSPETDIDGHPRPADGRATLGAHEQAFSAD